MPDREIKTIKLTDFEVDIITFLTWGEKEQIEACYVNGASVNASGIGNLTADAYTGAKQKMLEICIKEIRKNGEKIQYTKDWMNNLPAEDGDELFDAVDALYKPKKK